MSNASVNKGTVAINDTKFYVAVATLSIQNNASL